MPLRPPSPQSPNATPSITAPSTGAPLEDRDRTLLTTTQLAAGLERSFGFRLDAAAIETVLLEFDRRGYVEWVSITRNGDHVWDLTESPDRLAELVAEAVVASLRSWLSPAK